MSEQIEHIVHDNGIHELILYADDREAVDEYMGIIEDLVEDAIESDKKQKIRMLINLTQTGNMPPFTYITKKGRKMLHEHHKDRDKIHLRGALLARHNEMTIASLAEAFIKILPVDANMKAFESHHRDEAINWLLSVE